MSDEDSFRGLPMLPSLTTCKQPQLMTSKQLATLPDSAAQAPAAPLSSISRSPSARGMDLPTAVFRHRLSGTAPGLVGVHPPSIDVVSDVFGRFAPVSSRGVLGPIH